MRKSLTSLILLAILLSSGWGVAADKTLRGTASYQAGQRNDILPLDGPAYIPTNAAIRQADQWVKEGKLGVAEKTYQAILLIDANNAAAHNGLGKVAYQRTASSNQTLRNQRDDLLKAAVEHYQTALRLQPTYAEARLNLALTYTSQNRLDEAAEELSRVLTIKNLPPGLYSEALEKMGMTLVNQQQLNEAIPYLEVSLQVSPRNYSSRYYVAKAYTSQGEYDKAYEQLQMALSRDPNNALVHHQLGVVHQKMGNGAAAVAAYKKSLSLQPELAAPAIDLAELYLNRGDDVLALEQLKNMADAYPDNQALALRIAEIALDNNQSSVAAHYFERAYHASNVGAKTRKTAANGLSDTAYQTSYQLSQQLGNGRLAKAWQTHQAIEKTLTYNPGNLQGHLASVELSQRVHPNRHNQIDYNRSIYTVGLNQTPTTVEGHLAQGELLLDRYQFAQANERFGAAIRLLNSAKEAVTFGEIMLALGMPNQAAEAFQRANKLGMDSGFSKFGMAKSQEQSVLSRQKTQAALYYWKKGKQDPLIEPLLLEALQLDQRNAEAHLVLAQYYEKRRNTPQAADHYYAYLQLEPASGQYQSIQSRISRLKKAMAANS